MPWIDGDKIAKTLASTESPCGVTVRGVDFEMPARLPVGFPYYLMQEQVHPALRCLFGDRVDELLELAGTDISIDWLRDVVDAAYGEATGETSASSRPSSATRKSTPQRKRTSSGTTRKR
ncbi:MULTISPECIES: hypothetical protein [unclassified Nocardiopsis]|uniref:hypothetical protein n=1 Tax=unclassified Nocardiopsis TaxID=2649073 RepID=UPI00135CA86D|nr:MULTISPECIES: hypothetical protein [unclassified Nocardiopsis]